jgi:hypothetical protein
MLRVGSACADSIYAPDIVFGYCCQYKLNWLLVILFLRHFKLFLDYSVTDVKLIALDIII